MADSKEEPEGDELKWFECKMCKLREVYDSQETKPKFLQNISFNERSYIMKDPFTPPENKQFLVLGSDCYICKEPVCQANECSTYFRQRYCLNCAFENKNVFPEQLWSKIKSLKN